MRDARCEMRDASGTTLTLGRSNFNGVVGRRRIPGRIPGRGSVAGHSGLVLVWGLVKV